MIQRPEILLIGATGRNAGKTEYACRVIQRLASRRPVVAVKVTTVREGNGCPRGGAGCGVCGSLHEPFEITTETHAGTGKDTQRLLAAGAASVYWLRVHKDCLERGLCALLERIPPGQAAIVESNSARLVLQPGLFLVLREAGTTACKESCREVLDRADALIEYHEQNWSVGPERLDFVPPALPRAAPAGGVENGGWQLRWPAGAVILAGGASARMGTEKALLPFNGVPLVQHLADDLRPRFDGLIVGANNVERYSFLGLPIVPDREQGQGPLEGLRACLEASPHEWNFVTACDIPRVDAGLIARLFRATDNADAVVPVSPNGRREPLLALYRRSGHTAAAAALGAGERRLQALLARVRVREIPLGDAPWYHNLNTPDEYQRALTTTQRTPSLLCDNFGRRIHYLRVSVTDRCNLRCKYCMPADGVAHIAHARILSYEEIRDVVAAGIRLGINKVRLTGGEPLVRKGVVDLVRMLAGLPGLDDLAMTTNGVLLPQFAAALRAAGLQRINISLDTLDPERFTVLTRGGVLREVLDGIEAARQAGFTPIKLNCVVQEDANEPDARAVAAFAAERGLEVRFIRRMETREGRFSRVLGGDGGDCARCNRLRLSADGLLFPCLFSDLSYNVRDLGAEAAFRSAVAAKPERGSRSNHSLFSLGG
jgi:cyclic pyranopterin phosphate synthase